MKFWRSHRAALSCFARRHSTVAPPTGFDRYRWRIQRINETDQPFALIDAGGRFGDEFVATRISELDARRLADVLQVRFLG